MKRFLNVAKAATLAAIVVAAATELYAQCPPALEYVREDGVRRICTLRTESWGQFCLYECVNAPLR